MVKPMNIQKINLALYTVILTLTITLANAKEAEIRSDWVSNNDFEQIFDDAAEKQYYAHRVEGRLHKGKVQYRGTFKPAFKQLKRWYSYHGMPEDKYQERAAWFAEKGYKETCKNHFVDKAGKKLYQACWIKVADK
jgi:hypothetical protein